MPYRVDGRGRILHDPEGPYSTVPEAERASARAQGGAPPPPRDDDGGGEPSDIEQATDLALQEARAELDSITSSIEFTDELRAQLGPLGDLIGQDLQRLEQQNTTLADEESRARAAQLSNLESGGRATEQDLQLISQQIDAMLSAGGADIDRATEQEFERITQAIAPSRGLRPGDTPIRDDLERLSAEAVRSKGQLSSSLRAEGARLGLTLPLQRQQVVGDLSSATRDLQARLRQDALLSRTGLIAVGQTAFPGAPGTAVNIRNVLDDIATARAGRARGGGGGGSDLAGAAALIGSIAYASSSYDYKDNYWALSPDQEADVLERLTQLLVYTYKYRPEVAQLLGMDPAARHIGPMAEDYHRAFGTDLASADNKSIQMQDWLGLLTAAVRALHEKVQIIEDAISG